DVVRGRQLELFEHVEQPPDADTVAVVAPRVIPLLLRLALLGRIPAGALAVGIDLDVGRGAEGEPLATPPGIVLALADRDIVVTIVLGQRQHRTPPASIPNPKFACFLSKHFCELRVQGTLESLSFPMSLWLGISLRSKLKNAGELPTLDTRTCTHKC